MNSKDIFLICLLIWPCAIASMILRSIFSPKIDLYSSWFEVQIAERNFKGSKSNFYFFIFIICYLCLLNCSVFYILLKSLLLKDYFSFSISLFLLFVEVLFFKLNEKFYLVKIETAFYHSFLLLLFGIIGVINLFLRNFFS